MGITWSYIRGRVTVRVSFTEAPPQQADASLAAVVARLEISDDHAHDEFFEAPLSNSTALHRSNSATGGPNPNSSPNPTHVIAPNPTSSGC